MGKKSIFDLEKFLIYRLNQVAEETSLEFREVYRNRYGMTRPEWRVLANLGQFGSMTATMISKRALIHKTKVSRAVVSLETRRWLKRETDQSDRRFEHLLLTKQGLKAYEELGKEAMMFDKKLRAKLTKEEQDILASILLKLHPCDA